MHRTSYHGVVHLVALIAHARATTHLVALIAHARATTTPPITRTHKHTHTNFVVARLSIAYRLVISSFRLCLCCLLCVRLFIGVLVLVLDCCVCVCFGVFCLAVVRLMVLLNA